MRGFYLLLLYVLENAKECHCYRIERHIERAAQPQINNANVIRLAYNAQRKS